MTTEVRPPTLAEIRKLVSEGGGKLQMAGYGLEVVAEGAERDLITGYAGATALKHLRLALKEVDKARVQLDSIQRR